MTCTSKCNTSGLFESTREARLEAIAKAKRDEEARREQIARLNAVRQSIAVKEAKEQARFQALQDAENAFKIRERDMLERHLEETLSSMKRMQDQYQEFVVTTEAIAKKLENPAELFKTASILSVDEFKDYFKLTYNDGRVLKVPFGALDFMLKAKMDAINAEFNNHSKEIIQLQTDVGDANEQISNMAELFKTLVANVATHETDQQVKFEAFKCDVEKQIKDLRADITTIAESFKSVTTLVESLNNTVNSLVVAN